jgi:hypothetical protein
MTNETVDNRLTEFLNQGKDWERKQTNVPGVFLLKDSKFYFLVRLGNIWRHSVYGKGRLRKVFMKEAELID